jgi:hypothetical protein
VGTRLAFRRRERRIGLAGHTDRRPVTRDASRRHALPHVMARIRPLGQSWLIGASLVRCHPRSPTSDRYLVRPQVTTRFRANPPRICRARRRRPSSLQHRRTGTKAREPDPAGRLIGTEARHMVDARPCTGCPPQQSLRGETVVLDCGCSVYPWRPRFDANDPSVTSPLWAAKAASTSSFSRAGTLK